MKVLNINFAPRRRMPAWLGYGLVVVLLVAAADQGRQAWVMHREAKSLESAMAALSAKLARDKTARDEAIAVAQVEKPYARDIAEVARVGSFALNQVFAALESARVPGVKVTSLDISAVDGAVKVELEVSGTEALMRYLGELNAGEPTPRWQLVRAQTSSIPGAPGTASIESRWGVEESGPR